MANSFRKETYRSGRAYAYIVIVLLSLMAVLAALFVLFTFTMLLFPDFGLTTEDGENLNLGFALLSIFSLAELPLRILTALFFLIWLYRSYGNLSPLRARNLEHSPGWAVGWWFIPFANLVKPFQVVRELYNESDPEFDPKTGFLNSIKGTPFEVGVWWATYILSNIAFRISNALYGKGDLPESDSFAVPLIAGSILSATAAGFAIYIVISVARRQDIRFRMISELIHDTDPQLDKPVTHE